MPRITNNNPNYFSVTWEFTTTCNYSCWYCLDSLHDGKYRWPDLQKSLDFFTMLASKHDSIYLNLVGGEPTLWPDLLKFVAKRPKNIHVDVVTNGSRSIPFWKRVAKHLESVCISFHPDTADPDHIIEVLKVLVDSPVKSIYMWLLASKDSIDKCFYLYDKVLELDLPINMSPKTIYNMGMKYPQSVIDQNNADARVVEFLNRPKIKKCIYDVSTIKANEAYLDGEHLNVPLMVMQRENTFLGWTCTIGMKRLNIISNGDVFKGTCRIGGKVGNVFDGTYVDSIEPEVCTKRFCTCVEEIRLEKWKE